MQILDLNCFLVLLQMFDSSLEIGIMLVNFWVNWRLIVEVFRKVNAVRGFFFQPEACFAKLTYVPGNVLRNLFSHNHFPHLDLNFFHDC